MDSVPWDSKRVRVTISKKSIQSTSSDNLAPSTPENVSKKTSETEWETYGLMAPIVDFTAKGPKSTNKPHPQLSQLLRDGPSKVLNYEKPIEPPNSERTLFRWIHVPVNKMDWAQTVVENVLKEPKNGQSTQAPECEQLAEWMFDEKRWKNQRRGIEEFHPMYAQYLQPNVWRFKGNNYSVFMPYLHWDTAASNDKRSETIKWVTEGRQPGRMPDIRAEPELINSKLIAKYLEHGAYHENGGNLHVRRSLDQFYYDTQIQTDERDKDQIVFKYTRDNEKALKKKPVVMMVDQLWVWVLEDANIPTVVTSFPSMFRRKKNQSGEYEIVFRGSDLFQCILNDLTNESMPERNIAVSAADLALTIAKKASGVFVSRTLPYHRQFFFMFESAIADFAWKQTELWEQFRQNFKPGEVRKRKKARKNKNLCDEDDSEDKLLDIAQETDLVTNVRDILDELNIISCVIFEQKPVLEDMGRMPLPSAQNKKRHPLGYVDKVLGSVNKMRQDARREYSELKDLLDLKQKQASVAEAVASRQETAETARQGKTIMLFTVVTVVFLPPTFFTSVFGMNLREIGGLDSSTVAAVTVPISFFLIVLFLFLAFRDTKLGFFRRDNDADESEEIEGDVASRPKTQRRFSRLSLVRRRSSGCYDV